MIIKMALADEFNTEVGTQPPIAWRFIGDIESAVCYPYDASEWKVGQTEYDEFYNDGRKDIGFPTSVFVSAKKQNGKSVGIVSNVSVYLLNDNGKTIERLN